MLKGPLHASAFGPDGEVRAIELDEHPFFVATLFQPERAALAGRTPPIARALVEAALQYRALAVELVLQQAKALGEAWA